MPELNDESREHNKSIKEIEKNYNLTAALVLEKINILKELALAFDD